MNESLKPCPFCAHAPGVYTAEEIDGSPEKGHFAVCCAVKSGGCGATGPYHQVKDLAIAAWDRRA